MACASGVEKQSFSKVEVGLPRDPTRKTSRATGNASAISVAHQKSPGPEKKNMGPSSSPVSLPFVHSISVESHVRLAPMPVMRTSAPSRRRPSARASASARGIEPDDVLPKRIHVHDGPPPEGYRAYRPHEVDHPLVRLMRDVHVDVVDRLATLLEDPRAPRCTMIPRRELEDLPGASSSRK